MNIHDDEREARATLSWLFEPGDPHLAALLSAAGPLQALAALRAGADLPLRTRTEFRGASGPAVWSDVARAVDFTRQRGVRVLIPADPDWPDGISGPDAPICLWARGPAPLPRMQNSVTIVGTRASTAYGNHVAADLAAGLTEQARTVASTIGAGIDTAALNAVLANDGQPVAVLAVGHDQLTVTTRQHWQPLVDHGLLLSAYPLGVGPTRARLQYSRRLLAQLSAGTVLVEAGLHSPALLVVQDALDHRRAGMAVPSPITSAHSAACHDLLRRDPRIRLVTSTADVLAELTRTREAADE